MWRYFSLSAIITLVAVLAVGFGQGAAAAYTTLVLIAIEIAFSFDNAIVNAKILEKLSSFWRRLFLTVGMIIAIVGMRLLFPILIVVISAHLSFGQVINLALHHPNTYAAVLALAHNQISAFGGGFLLTLALYFLLDDQRKYLWLEHIERPLQKIGGSFWLPPLLAVIVVCIISIFSNDASDVLKPGLIGIAGYSLLKVFIDYLDRLEPAGNQVYSGKSALLAFIYLQVLDSAFSFDGVLGAFAITGKIVLIVIGLGIGALWVRNLTVFMVEKGTLKSYVYLEHGAHYAILVLAVALLLSIFVNVPDFVTGLVGLGFIAASFWESRQLIKHKKV